MEHINGLNGLRAIAVIMVVISHWLPMNHFLNVLPLGGIGVDVFFVLSGFLISRILFQQKKTIAENRNLKFQAIKNFIVRRALRIFPIYYLFLGVLYITNGSKVRDGFIYYLTYTSNYYFYQTKDWHGFMAHLWSLAVEEQFYIIWPLLVFFIVKKYSVKLLLFVIAFGTVFHLIQKEHMAYILTFSCINAFGIGALLAYVEVYKPNFEVLFKRLVKISFLPMIVLYVLQYTFFHFNYFPSRLFISIITVNCIVVCLVNDSKNILFVFLSNRVLNFVGMISYGIYLYHCPLPAYWRRIIRTFDLKSPFEVLEVNYYELLAQFALLIIISYFSWVIIEKPILKLKKHF